MPWALDEGPEDALPAEEEDEDHSRDHRRDGERQVDQGEQRVLAPEVELRDGPGRGHSEQEVEGDRHRGGQKRELERGQGHGLAQGSEVGRAAFAEGLVEDRDEGHDQEESQEGEGHADQQDLDQDGLARGAGRDPGASANGQGGH